MGGNIRKRIGRTGGITWLVTVEVGAGKDGKRKRTIKSVKGNKKDAEKVYVKMMNELKEGTLGKDTRSTLGEFLDSWMRTYVEPNLSPTTIAGYEVNINKHIKPYIGHIRLKNLTPKDIADLYDKLLIEGRSKGPGGLSAVSIKYIHRNLKQALQYAVNMNIISKNPAERVPLPKARKFRSEVYNENELRQLLMAVSGTNMEVPVALGVVLGLRRGELLGLKWGDVNFDEKKVTVNNNLINTARTGIALKDTKTESSRRSIPIPESIANMLKKHLQEQAQVKQTMGETYNSNDLVCCNEDGNPYDPKYFSNKFRKFLIRNGLKKIRLHDLRHSNATLMLKYGVPARIAAQRLGHSSVNVTLDIYSHVLQDMQHDVSDQIESRLLNKPE